MEKCIEKKYVVLDVETNGLSSLNCDLLSISIYKPDNEKIYDRLLPLELNSDVYTTYINGIKKKDLKNAKELTQKDVDNVIKEFELDKRTILTYGNLDERFIKNYFKRKKLKGFEKLKFYNFKHDIISSKYSGGNVTKDNLCELYNIENVKKIHNGVNDCILEWQLFKKMNENKLLITNNYVYELNNDYIIPVSYLTTYPNFKYCVDELPKFDINLEEIKKIQIKNDKMKKFDTNINGITIEHIINTLLCVNKIDSVEFLLENKRKLNYIGKLPSIFDEIDIQLNRDGTVSAINEKDNEIVEKINKSIEELRKNITPLINFLKKDIFKNKEILSQELVVSQDKKVFALCDLSNDVSVMEIKTFMPKIENIKYQLYYESKGRECYLLYIDWSKMPQKLIFNISKVKFIFNNGIKDMANKEQGVKIYTQVEYKNNMMCKDIEIIEFNGLLKNLVKFKCKKCGKKWDSTYKDGLTIKRCPFCGD